MSYVGKILVVVQVVMSLLFMAFAGAVYSMHQNWRTKHDAVKTQLDQTQQSLTVAQGELETARAEFNTKETELDQKATAAEAKNATFATQVATLQSQRNLLEQQRETQTGLAEAKAAEAKFRQEEAQLQRIENKKLQDKLDQIAADNRELRDQLFTKGGEFDELAKQYNSNLRKTAYLERVVASHKLETDPVVVERMQAPPPPVDGIVIKTKRDRTNRVHFVEISVGSDDGLVKNHTMDVVRVPDDGDSEWLGRLRVVDVFPDTAVCEVIIPAKNGIIQEGDNVTTKL